MGPRLLRVGRDWDDGVETLDHGDQEGERLAGAGGGGGEDVGLPSSAGGMALAWTGVGVTKPAAARRPLSAGRKRLKSLKWTSATRGRPVVGAAAASWAGV